MTDPSTFSRFQVGDYVVLDHVFAQSDFAAFSALSGDRNPLHHDADYASHHGGKPIVPLHMTLAPLSAIAGMDFPGEPSLYLGHEVRAAKPVHYDETITYSARIESINTSHRVLKLRVLALRADEVVLDATMRVQARYADWALPPLHVVRNAEPRTALVTGASGDIGQAIAIALAREGWNLLLQDRGQSERRSILVNALERGTSSFEFLTADLTDPSGIARITDKVRATPELGLVAHTASPAVRASISEHIALSYTALKAIGEACITGMLRRQAGALVLIGTAATETSIPGWEDYSSAKAMGSQLLRTFDRRFAEYGITGHTLAPGLVATRFSQSFRSDGDRALMPAQVAAALSEMLESRFEHARDMLLTPLRQARGRFGFLEDRVPPNDYSLSITAAQIDEPASPASAGGQVDDIVRSVLRLPATFDMVGSGLGTTPGWDSFKHIELILATEIAFGVRFTSAEIEETHRHADLSKLLARKLSEAAS